MGNSLANIGVSGLRTAQAQLLTTSHNISNASTPGYNRQQAIASTNIPDMRGNGFVGQGVQVSTVQRIFSQFLFTQSLQTQNQSSQLDSYYNEVKQLDNLLADTSSGLTPALHAFFNAVQDVAANPASVPSRQAMLSNAEALTGRFQSMDQRFSEVREGVNSQLTSSVDEINSLAKQIGRMNLNIQTVEGSSGGQPANDLRDQRDALIRDLSKLANVSVVRQDNGHHNVFIGNGQALVVGSETMALKAVPSREDPQRLTVAMDLGSKTVLIPEHQLQGGSMGGLIAFRNETLDSAQNEFGLLALGLAKTFNDQHRLGQDLSGLLGEDFFKVPEPEILSALDNTSASSVTAIVSDVSKLTASDYRLDFDGSNYTLTRLTDNTATAPTAGLPLTLDGLSVTSGSMQAGEYFVIQPTREAARNIQVAISDTAKIAAAAPIRTEAATSNTGTGKISAGKVDTLDANLQQAVTITFHSPFDGKFDIAGVGAAETDKDYESGADISFNGLTVQISGEPAAGDTFTIGANTSGVSDNRNALLLAGLQTKKTLIGGTASLQSGYARLVSQIGNQTRELEVMNTAQANLLAQTDQSLQSLSGVNLEEEAANLLRYQQAFQASSKVIEVSNTLFDTLLRI
ncbi:flagellar hook-associated protein FlgK [Nitrosomonas mobilis]|uniref:Flagellar hook-associated protein 1 n=1 Tax=Nitrosomonas mobilis TaxID=51642 RepID=A0A1G5SD78_9PROT|nr:flagellar hook-associated protein FlgK [Nitrosomonas mobilis]SCZ85156.1 Flagellar hook-associated protein FlgK [Nitrosomonas mobilis]